MLVRRPSRFRQIYDPVRLKWVAATPEEEVRQSVITYLLKKVRVPPRLLGVEFCLSQIEPGNFRRADILVWKPGADNRPLAPWLLVECKAQGEPLGDEVTRQVSRYLSLCRCRYLMVTNGLESGYWELWEQEYRPISVLPLFG